ncbi:hypothetical protein PanWU01x14_035890 [Parasponia andersonii]|uniref:Uncharacterized protein n=1 Tax=Parasponia andersonii TaxID=3476 RepID=A0A2P5DSB4_PARAD|nr:hypothetical protein PanWU01x14_035890 [Parasponia andersonii]
MACWFRVDESYQPHCNLVASNNNDNKTDSATVFMTTKLMIGNSKYLSITHNGSTCLHPSYHDRALKLLNVLRVPQIKKSLMLLLAYLILLLKMIFMWNFTLIFVL